MLALRVLVLAASSLFLLTSSATVFTCKDPGWFLYGNRCYRMFYNKKNYSASEDACKQKGGTLFLPRSVDILRNVTDHMPFVSNAWVGLQYDSPIFSDRSIDENSKSLLSSPKRVRDKIGSKCASVFRQSEKTRSIHWSPCQTQRPFICQMDALEMRQPRIEQHRTTHHYRPKVIDF